MDSRKSTVANLNIFDVLRQLVDINNKGFEGSLAGLTTFITNYLSYAKNILKLFVEDYSAVKGINRS